MATECLTRRAEQLRLLGRACECRVAAQIGPRRPGVPAQLRPTHLVALQADAVMLEAPDDANLRNVPAGLNVEVVFEQDGERYTFTTHTRGTTEPWLWPTAGEPLWRLAIPLRLERRQPRRHMRTRLADEEIVYVRLTGVFDQNLCFDLRMTDISAGGFAGIVDRAAAGQPSAASPFWATFTLPGQPDPVEYVARLIHCQTAPGGDHAVLGWAFCGGDDHETDQHNAGCVQRFLAARTAAGPAPAAEQSGRRR